MSKTTDFGFERVPPEEKSRRVRGVFESVAAKYDLMNDLMSAGLHRAWERFAVETSGGRRGGAVLDVAGGTADLARLFAERVGPSRRLRLVQLQRPAAPGQARRRRRSELSLPCRVDPHASRSGSAEGNDGERRARARRMVRFDGRHRRLASRLRAVIE